MSTTTEDPRTVDELQERARELGIPGRSSMNKDELIDAVDTFKSPDDTDTDSLDASDGELRVYEVRHEGHDVAGYSVVCATSPQRARELIREALDDDGHGLSHSNTHLEVRKKSAGDTPHSVALDVEGVVVFDDGRVH